MIACFCGGLLETLVLSSAAIVAALTALGTNVYNAIKKGNS